MFTLVLYPLILKVLHDGAVLVLLEKVFVLP